MGLQSLLRALVVAAALTASFLPSFASGFDVSYGKLPLSFVENRGQVGKQAKFVIRGPRGSAFFTSDAVVFDLRGKEPSEFEKELFPLSDTASAAGYRSNGKYADRELRDLLGADGGEKGVALWVRFVDANPDVAVEGWEVLPGKVNYLVGDPSKWKTDIATYRGVIYRNVWPGIDVIYRGDPSTGSGCRLKYDIRVSPGDDLSQIRLRYEGAEKIWLDDSGDLHIWTAIADFVEKVPGIYQADARLAGGYTLLDDETVGFRVEGYDPSLPLVIDPQSDLVWSTFLGGVGDDFAYAIAVDSTGCAYVAGETGSSDFPTTPGAFDTSRNGNADAFVTKLNASGSALVYSTFLGGNSGDSARAIALDSSGCAYVAGETGSSDFPTTPGAFDTIYCEYDAFVTKLNASGSALVYSTFLGGWNSDTARAIAVDSTGCAYVAGRAGHSSFPTTPGAFDTSWSGACPDYCCDAFVTKLNASGSALVYSTFLGGGGGDQAYAITLDSPGCAYVAGYTDSSNFPTTPGAFDTSYNGRGDAFVTKLNASGSALVYSTFLGGTSPYSYAGDDYAHAIALDSSGCAYVAGYTYSSDFPTTPGAFDTSYNGCDAFVTKLNPSGSALVYSTFLSDTGEDCAYAIALDTSGCAYVAGYTNSPSFPTTPGAFDTSYNGSYANDAFVTKLNASGSALVYSTFLGGGRSDDYDNSDCAYGIALDTSGCAYVAGYTYVPGHTFLSNFPTTPGAFDTSYNDGCDAFVSKFLLPASSIGVAKKRANAGAVSLWGQPITFAPSDVFYIEASDQSSGIRVEKAGHGLAVGMRADVAGTVKTNPDGERYIEASTAVQNGTGTVQPLSMPNRSIGGGNWLYDPSTGAGQQGVKDGVGLNSIGLLVRTCGWVKQTGSGYMYVNDGTNLKDGTYTGAEENVGVRVICDPSGYTSANYVLATGASSCFKDPPVTGQVIRRILTRDGSDVVKLVGP